MDSQSPRLLAQQLASRYADWSRSGMDLVRQAALLADMCTISRREHLTVIEAVARKTAAWTGHPYHSVAHHGEVATNAAVLAMLQRGSSASGEPGPLACYRLLCAALGHDIGFDPAAPRMPFCLEAQAALQVREAMRTAGADQADAAAVELLILATEPSARRSLRAQSQGAGLPLPAPLRRLAAQPDLLDLACILSDADLLSSSGLTPELARAKSRLMERETGHEAGAGDFLAFLDGLVGDGFISPGGRCMNPNLALIHDEETEALSRLQTPSPQPH